MLDSTYSEDTMMGRQFAEGTPVYDVTGTKVGTVSEQGVQGDNLVLQKGLFFPHEYYVPLRTITDADVSGIYLNVTKDDVTNQDFDSAAPVDAMSGEPAHGNGVDRPLAEGAARDIADAEWQTDSEIGRRDIPRERAMRVPVREEELNIGKQQTEAGHVHIHEDVVEERQSVNVPATHEDLLVERVPVRGDAIDVGPDTFTDRDFDVPLRGEQVVANKEARVAEEVRLHKQQVTENRRVGDMVRKEHVRIEGDGIVQGQGNEVPFGRDDPNYEQTMNDAQSRRGI